MSYLLFPLILVGLVIVFAFGLYNKLVTLRLRIKEAWSDIDVQLKRRNSLIPNLVESVKGYMTHEKDLLTKITALRTQVESETDRKELGKLDSQLSSALGSLKVAVEAYPDLKANQNVQQLQEELTSTEDKISFARRFYNQNVLSFNTSIATFPAVLLAGPLGFKAEEFFEASEEDRKEVKVDLSTK